MKTVTITIPEVEFPTTRPWTRLEKACAAAEAYVARTGRTTDEVGTIVMNLLMADDLGAEIAKLVTTPSPEYK